jgi:hypothetical protein
MLAYKFVLSIKEKPVHTTLASIPENGITGEANSYVMLMISDKTGEMKIVLVEEPYEGPSVEDFCKNLSPELTFEMLGGGNVFPSKQVSGTLLLKGTHPLYGKADHYKAGEIINRTTGLGIQLE